MGKTGEAEVSGETEFARSSQHVHRQLANHRTGARFSPELRDPSGSFFLRAMLLTFIAEFDDAKFAMLKIAERGEDALHSTPVTREGLTALSGLRSLTSLLPLNYIRGSLRKERVPAYYLASLYGGHTFPR